MIHLEKIRHWKGAGCGQLGRLSPALDRRWDVGVHIYVDDADEDVTDPVCASQVLCKYQ